PYGIVLVTGPTGSGKTTTLYAVLKEIATPDENVVTLEDPIEYLVDGITQVHVQPKAGLTFEKGLEAIMRQDPDIILVGEIRDAETARIAARAAMTGHLLLSTLHTNDSAEAVQRLDEMGVEPYLLASSLLGILAQRLLRRICPKCEETDPVESPLLPGAQLRRGRGCANCNQTGYRGRDGIYELLPASEEIRRLVAAGADAGRIRWQARQQGMRTLREEAIEKVRQGRTTLSEALSLTRADEDIGPP
ncbi:MAG: type II/IV secretion system protein, partial [Planctomycetes bacterium]|nr:type II/IV secretion system protein [Planctomycetota bacterium]